ncbi:helix-turn-helix domain-containing protein [Amycolatopsis sp. NPDC003865]
METGLVCGPSGVLSDRELEVLAIVAQDRTDREIASRLAISERTVRAHVSRIIRKLGVASRVGAAVVFVEWKARVEPAGVPAACDVGLDAGAERNLVSAGHRSRLAR